MTGVQTCALPIYIDSGEYREKIRYSFPFARKMIDYLHQGDYKMAFDSLKYNHSIEA